MRALIAIAFLTLVRAQPSVDARLPELLKKAAAGAERFAQEFPALTCNERVTQLKLDERGKPVEKREEIYDYLILLDVGGDDFTFEESRIRRDGPNRLPRQPLLATTGFAVMALLFHPYYQDSFRYVRAGAETRDGMAWEKVRFEHIAGRASPSGSSGGHRAAVSERNGRLCGRRERTVAAPRDFDRSAHAAAMVEEHARVLLLPKV